MSATKTLLVFLAITLSLAACKKDENDGDLTTAIVGHYVNTSTSTDIVVNKVDDTHVSIQLATTNSLGDYSVGFTNVTMNTATTFTLNTVTANNNCGDHTFSGTGTHSGNNISLFMTVAGFCNSTESVSATRI